MEENYLSANQVFMQGPNILVLIIILSKVKLRCDNMEEKFHIRAKPFEVDYNLCQIMMNQNILKSILFSLTIMLVGLLKH